MSHSLLVQYFTHRTLTSDGKQRLARPEKMGPLTAIVLAEVDVATLDLMVFLPSGRQFVARHVTTTPTTAVQHYWRKVEDNAGDK